MKNMKPFFLVIFYSVLRFFRSFWENGNVFTITVGILFKLIALLLFFAKGFVNFSVLIFVLGLIISYLGLIRLGINNQQNFVLSDEERQKKILKAKAQRRNF